MNPFRINSHLFLKVLFGFLLFPLFAEAQTPLESEKSEYKRTLSFSQLIDEMINCQDSIYVLTDAQIKYVPETDMPLSYGFSSLWGEDYKNTDSTTVEIPVSLNNVHFTENISAAFTRIHFKSWVYMDHIIAPSSLGFLECTFDQGFQFYPHKDSEFPKIQLINNLFKGGFHTNIYDTYLELNNCHFQPDSGNFSEKIATYRITGNSTNSFIVFQNCLIDSLGPKDQFTVFGRDVFSIRFYNNTINIHLFIQESTIQDLTIHDNAFNGLLNLANTRVGRLSEIYPKVISKRIAAYSNLQNMRIWRPDSASQFHDELAADRLFGVYRQLTEHYKSRGNIRSYNKMFIEMKELQTMQLEYYYSQDKSLANFFSWKMNIFLGTFSDYGTSPVKAILYSLRVILIFSIFFFFFHNTWDSLTKEQLMSTMLLFTRYFRSEESLAKLYEKNASLQYKPYSEFMEYMNESKEEIPKAFLWIASPFYQITTFSLSGVRSLLSRMDILKGRWSDLNSGKKQLTSIIGGLVLLFLLILSLIMKAINAVMLSLNSFTTLGFGEIPMRGIGRYVAIVEGFLGWSLLTLFSVSLITQLLQ